MSRAHHEPEEGHPAWYARCRSYWLHDDRRRRLLTIGIERTPVALRELAGRVLAIGITASTTSSAQACWWNANARRCSNAAVVLDQAPDPASRLDRGVRRCHGFAKTQVFSGKS